ncbi:SRPBCC domain-containing protein [Paramicrobacterium chengjingii]|uniref:SRPBCC domain-containing protein n=1 Tax=Paramicrobacterium chengjingii TaxID=2769067 RepID=A0ABX6YG39_9MICO|nr:SRPBCC domain-containing protein [Microbacterium chengjingii]QPZ37762.1 SRPBCC domain-containing protein [Microbacterium chengjingii]
MAEFQLPEHPLGATLIDMGTHQLLTLERTMEHSTATLWPALTERAIIVRWAPFSPDRDLDRLGTISLRQTDDLEANANLGKVLTAATQQMLSLMWADDRIDIELAPSPEGTIVQLSHVFADVSLAPSLAAGWHICLQALDAVAGGIQIPLVVGDAAHAAGWDALYDEYMKRL